MADTELLYSVNIDRMKALGLIADPEPCQDIMNRAKQFYKEPLKDLKLKASIEELYKQSGSEDVIGQWVTTIPKPGEVAGCINKKLPKERVINLF